MRLQKLPGLLLASFLAPVLATAAVAHEVQIADDVGATMHIEPNDIARAGSATDLWFALTRAGGTVIPLTDCDCTLTVYDSQETAIATPPLTPVSAEGFDAIPGATLTFPEVGSYELVLAGSPRDATQFTPFELAFEVTVASRASSADAPAPASVPDPSSERETEEEAESAAVTSDAAVTESIPQSETAQAEETSAPALSSKVGLSAVVGGGVIVILGITIALLIRRRQSSGGKA